MAKLSDMCLLATSSPAVAGIFAKLEVIYTTTRWSARVTPSPLLYPHPYISPAIIEEVFPKFHIIHVVTEQLNS